MPKVKAEKSSVVRKELASILKKWGWTKSGLMGLMRSTGGGSSKGSSYERDICRRLSKWWTSSDREDVFWRSSGSGARAKVRGKAGRETTGQHGDIAATDPIGAPFIDLFTIELKKGYSSSTFHDIADRLTTGPEQEYESFFNQTLESYEQAGSWAWLLLTHRAMRRGIVWMPMFALNELRDVGAFPDGKPNPFVGMRATIRDSNKIMTTIDVCAMTLDDWLAGITPEQLKTLSEKV